MSKTKDLQRKAAGRAYRESLRAIVDAPPGYRAGRAERAKQTVEQVDKALDAAIVLAQTYFLPEETPPTVRAGFERRCALIGVARQAVKHTLTHDINTLACGAAEVELLQRRVAERDRAALIAAAQFDAETRRAEDAHDEAQRWALEVERLREHLKEADKLLEVAYRAHQKMGLEGEGARGHSHEVRMFALHFSQPETPETPEHVILSGNGRYRRFRQRDREQVVGKEE